MNNILVVGDSCVDVFVYGDCYRLNPEAPTPVLKESYRKEYEGMAANVLNNVKSLGLEADFISQNQTIVKTRYVDEKSNYILLRIDNDNPVTPINIISVTDFSKYDLVIISDYDKGFLTTTDIDFIFRHSKLTFIDTKKPIDEWIRHASFVKINEAEYINPKNNLDFMEKENHKFIITLGDKGAVHDHTTYRPKKHVKVRDVVGAGDSFLAALACHYHINKDMPSAIEFANVCAGEVVSQKGIAFPKQKLL